jgi:hypothetical protein
MERKLSQQEELRNRTKRFALRIIKLFQHLPRTTEAQVLGKQLSSLRDFCRGELSGGGACPFESGVRFENKYCLGRSR